LSYDKKTALNVGQRHGKPVILSVDARRMYDDGVKFYISNNGVWLTMFVDKKYLGIVA
jgi:putative RNA 2'-phosphotransferase